jgi:hypothetical protein
MDSFGRQINSLLLMASNFDLCKFFSCTVPSDADVLQVYDTDSMHLNLTVQLNDFMNLA